MNENFKVMHNCEGKPPGPEMENCCDRESYSLAAGLALGMIGLGKGEELAGIMEKDWTHSTTDMLYHYMIGGHKREVGGGKTSAHYLLLFSTEIQ